MIALKFTDTLSFPEDYEMSNLCHIKDCIQPNHIISVGILPELHRNINEQRHTPPRHFTCIGSPDTPCKKSFSNEDDFLDHYIKKHCIAKPVLRPCEDHEKDLLMVVHK